VPLFYYLLHIPLIHVTALLVGYLRDSVVGAERFARPPMCRFPHVAINLAIVEHAVVGEFRPGLSLLVSARDQESVAHIKGVESTEVAEALLPRAGFKIGFETCDAACDDMLVEERKARHPRSHLWIEIGLGSPPIRSEEPIGAVVRYGDAIHSAISKVVHEIGDRGAASAVEIDELGEVEIREPEVADFAGLESEDHQARRHPSELVEAAPPIRPVMQREQRERRIEGIIPEGQSFSRCLDDRGNSRRSLPDHVR
jgi:hypothetical protein